MSHGLDISHFEPGHVPVKDCLGQLAVWWFLRSPTLGPGARLPGNIQILNVGRRFHIYINISLCVLENFGIKEVVIALLWYSTQMLPPMTTLRSAADCYGCTQDWHIRVSFQVLEVRDMTSSACTDHYILSLHTFILQKHQRDGFVRSTDDGCKAKAWKYTFECFRATRVKSMSF